jgi:hypothetical protein
LEASPSQNRPLTSIANPFRSLSNWQRLAVIGFLLLFVPLGAMVVRRSAFLDRRMGDVGCYFRAAWAVRAGVDPYTVVEENKFHYNYPPFLAIVMTPLADAPADEPRPWMLPYWGSVLVWYLISVVALALGVHWLASALEDHMLPDFDRASLRGSYRWWALRLLPVMACIIPIGHSFMRGQVNLIVILCLCATMAAMIRGQSWRAGWWLAWPITIKVFPAFLLLYPLVQRNWRCLGGCAVGLIVGLGLVPAVYFGPQRTVDYYTEFARVTLAPGLGVGADQSRAEELTNLTSTDSQSFVAMLHNTIHPNRYTRPHDASPTLRRVSYVLGAAVLLLTLTAGRWSRIPVGPDICLYLGTLVLVMLFICPVCHLHYYSFATPLMMGVLASSWKERLDPVFGWGLILLFAVNIVGNIVPNLPGCEALRERGFATIPALILWATALVSLWSSRRQAAPAEINLSSGRLAA